MLGQFRQIIAYGPPGTGKTREAKRVALALLSGKEPKEDANEDEIEKLLEPYRKVNRFDLVVFHPAYEYEQFVVGIEPNEIDGKVAFRTKPGVFLRLCHTAKQNQQQPCVLIIDEINRGNLPKLLGELVYALEYRGHEVSLPFTCEGSDKLIVPKNLYIIATMNSADRSIGHIDVAIRRRFALFPLLPGPADAKYKDVLERVDSAALESVDEVLKVGIQSSDWNQLYVYIRISEATCGFFIVPFWDAKGTPIAWRDNFQFVKSPRDGNAKVRVAVLGLNLLHPLQKVKEEAANQLRDWLSEI